MSQAIEEVMNGNDNGNGQMQEAVTVPISQEKQEAVVEEMMNEQPPSTTMELFTDFTQDFDICERLSIATSYCSKRRSTWFQQRPSHQQQRGRRSQPHRSSMNPITHATSTMHATSARTSTSSSGSISSMNSSNNNDILYDLQQLSLLERERKDDEVDMNQYRSQVKRLLTNLLMKMEESIDYQKVLEEELFRLEHIELENRRLQKQLDRTNRKLEEMTKEKERLKNARKVELQVLSEYTTKISKSIEELNHNFEMEEEEDDDDDDDDQVGDGEGVEREEDVEEFEEAEKGQQSEEDSEPVDLDDYPEDELETNDQNDDAAGIHTEET